MILGYGYTEETHSMLSLLKQFYIKYIEIEPSLVLKENILNNLKEFEIAFHGTNLNIASHDELKKEFQEELVLAKQLAKPFLITEHMSYFAEGDIDIPIYIPPVYNKENALRLANKIKQYNFIDGYENVPNYIFNNVNSLSEGEFFNILCNESNKKIMLNLDSLFMSSMFLNKSVKNILQDYPIDSIVAITYVPTAAMHPMIAKYIKNDFKNNIFNILDTVLQTSKCNHLLFQAGHFSNMDNSVLQKELEDFLVILNKLGVKYE